MRNQSIVFDGARPSEWSKRDEQSRDMQYISWQAGEQYWLLKVPEKPKDFRRKRGGPNVDFRVAVDQLVGVREEYLKGRELGRERPVGRETRLTVAQGIELYLGSLIKEPKTIEGYTDMLRDHVAPSKGPSLGGIVLKGLQPLQIQQWLKDKVDLVQDGEVGYGPPSIAKALTRLKTFLKWCVINRDVTGLESNPAAIISIRDYVKKNAANSLEDYVTDPSETARLYAACWEEIDGARQLSYMAALPILATDVGLRRSEISALRWMDLDLDGLVWGYPTITIMQHLVTAGRGAARRTRITRGSKASVGKRETLRLSPISVTVLRAARIALAEHRLRQGRHWMAGTTDRAGYQIPSDPIAPEALVFPGLDGGVRLGEALASWFVRTICRRAGITTKSLHSLRHDCATFLIGKGVPITVVSRHMRHASVQMTAERYAHLLKSQEALASDTMGSVLAEALAGVESVAV